MIVRRVGLMVLTVGRVAVLLSILTTTTVARLELLTKLVSPLAWVTEAPILDTAAVLLTTRNMTGAQLIAWLRSGLRSHFWSGLWSCLRSGVWCDIRQT